MASLSKDSDNRSLLEKYNYIVFNSDVKLECIMLLVLQSAFCESCYLVVNRESKNIQTVWLWRLETNCRSHRKTREFEKFLEFKSLFS